MSAHSTPPPDPRPRPQYGEYATPEEQRARIQHPDATWALDAGQAPAETPATETHGWPVDTSPAPPVAPARNADRIVTLALLIVGGFNVALSAVSYFDLANLAGRAMELLGMPGEFTNVASAQLWGPIAAVVLIVGFLITAFFAWRRVRAKRLSWWVPLVGAVVTYALVYVCLAIPLLGDPAFVQFAS